MNIADQLRHISKHLMDRKEVDGIDVNEACGRGAEAIAEMKDALSDLAEAARNACDARQHPPLTDALFGANWVLSKVERPTTGAQPQEAER